MNRQIDSGLRHASVVVVTTALLLGAALAGATVGVVNADAPSVAVTNETGGSAVEAPTGETVTVTVSANASNVSAYQANLTFDPAVVRVVSVSGTSDFSGPVTNIDNESGWVAFNQYQASNVTDPRLATVTVELVGEPGNATTLAFAESDTKLSDAAAQEQNPEQYDGLTVTVASESDGSDSGGSDNDGGDGSDDSDGGDGSDGSDEESDDSGGSEDSDGGDDSDDSDDTDGDGGDADGDSDGDGSDDSGGSDDSDGGDDSDDSDDSDGGDGGDADGDSDDNDGDGGDADGDSDDNDGDGGDADGDSDDNDGDGGDADGDSDDDDSDDSDDSDDDDSDDSDDDDSDDSDDDDSDDSDDDGGSSGGSSGSSNSDGGDSDTGRNDETPASPPHVASNTVSLNENASVIATFDGSSSTVDRIELLLGAGVSGDYVTTEFERLPADIADSRGDDASEVVTVVKFSTPEEFDGSPKQLNLALNRSAVEASNVNADRLQIERYDETMGQWETLTTTVDSSDEGTVTLTAAPSRLGWFVVAVGNASQTTDADRAGNGTNVTSPGSGESPNGTAADSAGSGATATGDSDTTENRSNTTADESDTATEDSGTTNASSTEGDGTTQSEVPGFGVTSVLAAGALLYGGLRFRRRGQ